MSASREKKSRQVVPEQELTDREQKRLQEAKAERRSMMTYTVVGILVAVLAVALVIWNSGLIQRNMTAVTINGAKYNAADVQYYFNTTLSNAFGMSPGSMDLKGTIMNEETGQTAYDYVLELTLESMVTATALADKAEAEGLTLSQEAKDYVASSLAELDSSWAAMGYPSRDAFLRTNFGPYITYDQLEKLLTQQALADEYISSSIDALEYSDSDYETYYKENTDSLDSFTYTYYLFQAAVETTDDDGNTIEMTEEETAAALEEAKTAKKALAEELMARLEDGEDPEALAEEYADELFSSEVSAVRTGSVVNASYSEWVYDSTRKDGDVTLTESESTSVCNYYVVRFEGRERDETVTDDVRHILVDTEEEAQSLLDQWKSGEATEDSFAALAQEHSTDTGSAVDGGLIAGITPTASYVESFRDWAVDSARKSGDTGIVESNYGWHIMYYVGEGDPTWKVTADSSLRSEAYYELMETTSEGYEAVTGSGIRFVEG